MTAGIKAVVNEALKFAVPTKEEQRKLDSSVKDIIKKVSAEIKKQKLDAKIVVGGSVAKGTWLPGISDIDFFMLFDYDEFSDRSTEISNLAGNVLKKVLRNLQKLHGSRDYFSAKHDNYNSEFVPVLDISNGQQARNLTDYSPLHVKYITKNAKNKDDIRLAKQFMKAAGVYGAESYISGFSGHVVDLLVSYYGTFEKLLRAAVKWKFKDLIDPARFYRTKQAALSKLNVSKIIGPLVLVDPIESDRNAAAALSLEKFNVFIDAARKFLSRPSLEFFREKLITLTNLEGKKRGRTLIVFETKTPTGKVDIIGAKMKSLFEDLQRLFAKEDFDVREKGWLFNSVTRFWFYFDKKPLSATKMHFGPPINLAKEHIDGFKKAWKGHKISVKDKKYIVLLKRKFTKPEQLAKTLAKEFKLKLIVG